MVISKEKYYILDLLKKKNFKDDNKLCTYDSDDDFYWLPVFEILHGNWGEIIDTAKSNIELISRPFLSAVEKNLELFLDIDPFDFMFKNRCRGTILIGSAWVVYDFANEHNMYLWAVTDSDCINTFILARSNSDNAFYWSTNRNNKMTGSNDSVEHMAKVWISFVSSILMFKYYAKVETRILAPNEKITTGDKMDKKHINRGGVPITILDCTWFTNIIRDSPFGVRGHFRLQPKKNDKGEWIKELIYIEPFMKRGYNIKAKKTLQK